MNGRRKMPVSRDVRVRRDEARTGEETSAKRPEERGMANVVTVTGFDRKDVLFQSDSVGTVQWRDQEGEVAAMLVSLRPGIWGFTRRGEEDWEENLRIYGSPAG